MRKAENISIFLISVVSNEPKPMMSRFRSIAATNTHPLNTLFQLALSRLYGSVATAQPVLNPDCYYDDYQEELERRRDRIRLDSVPLTDAEGQETTRGVQWALIGRPRSRKHIYADMLSKLLEVPHISMASLVRQDLSPRSSLYKQIANALNQGDIIPEDIIFGLLSKRLKDGYCRGENGFILDGIPRTRNQAEVLDQLAEIDLVVNFKCTEDLEVKSQEGSWKQKFQAFTEQSKPLEDYYRKREKILEFQVGSTGAETWQGLLTALHLQHKNAAHSSQELITGFHLF